MTGIFGTRILQHNFDANLINPAQLYKSLRTMATNQQQLKLKVFL